MVLSWNEMYNLAKLYYEEYDNLLIPAQYITSDNIKLGNWIAKQRKCFKSNKLLKEQIKLLEKIGIDWSPLDSQWYEYYNLAVKYYKENGNLFIPLKYVTANNINLGYWIGTQRRRYKAKKITKERIDLLEKIGMIWSQYDLQWYQYYDLLVNYHNAYGNSLVPLRYTTQNNEKLGSWVSHQRKDYKSNKLSKEKIDLLEKIDMIWEPADYVWDKTYEIAKQYYEENNNLNIPNNFFYKNVSLGSWIITQRNNYNQSLLTDTQVEKLNKIGMEWISSRNEDYAWENNYNTVLEFYNKYKHLYVPTSYYSKDGTNIGRWFYEQKLKYKKKKLSDYRRNKLEMLDKSWLEPSNTKSSFPEQAVLYYIKKYFPSATKFKTKEVSEIDIYIPELNVGIEYDGAMHIKRIKKDIEKTNACKKQGINLIRIRECECPIIDDDSYKIILKNDSFEALECGIIELLKHLKISNISINIQSDYIEISDNYIKSIDIGWFDKYERLKEYYNEYGNIDVPIHYKTTDGFLLGHWLSNIRNSVKNPSANGMRLNSNKIELLDKLGMNWASFETQWEKLYSLAKNYYNKHGNLLVPDLYITNEKIKLGRWIGTQRANYKKGKLSQEKINLLEKIGMVWSAKNKNCYKQND